MSEVYDEPASVRFYEGRRGGLSVVEFDLPNRQRGAGSLERFLSEMKLRVVHGENLTRANRHIRRVYVEERDGSAISADRRLEIQTHVLSSMLQGKASN